MLKLKEPVILLRTCRLIFVNNTCRRVCIDWLYWYSNRSVTGYRFPYSSPLLSIPNLKHAIRIVRYSFWKCHFYFYLFQNLLKKCNKFSICLNHIIFYDSFLCRKIWAFDWQHMLCLVNVFFNWESAYLWEQTVHLFSSTCSFIHKRQTSYRGFSRETKRN